eukprot:SAG31_NODE_2995_length_4804_cov_9.959192_2_plen_529_part_00
MLPGEDDLLGSSPPLRIHDFLQTADAEKSMPTELQYKGSLHGQVQLFAQFHRKVALSSTKSIAEMLAARNHRRSLRDRRRSAEAVAIERLPKEIEPVQQSANQQRARGLSTVQRNEMPPHSPEKEGKKLANINDANAADMLSDNLKAEDLDAEETETKIGKHEAEVLKTSADEQPTAAGESGTSCTTQQPQSELDHEPAGRGFDISKAFTPRLQAKLDFLQTPRGEKSDHELVVPRQRQRRRRLRAHSATIGRHVGNGAMEPELARPASATVFVPPPVKPSIYRKPPLIWRSVDAGWGTHRVITPAGEHLHLTDTVFDDLRHADPTRLTLRRRGYKVYSCGEWRGRGATQLCKLFALKHRDLAGPNASHLASWPQRRAVLSELIRAARSHLGIAPNWAVSAVADGLQLHLGVRWAFEPCQPSSAAGREKLSFSREFSAAQLILYLGSTLGALYKGIQAISGVFYEETQGQAAVRMHRPAADPRRTESEPPRPVAKSNRSRPSVAGLEPQVGAGQQRLQAVRVQASANF